mmetsp:Transcript_86611/g.234725  ORF Transcript_86611/g.234725 Transcript_86611/m.234725 type:complete len:224 (+) Transcript_86611:481-1152(+)
MTPRTPAWIVCGSQPWPTPDTSWRAPDRAARSPASAPTFSGASSRSSPLPSTFERPRNPRQYTSPLRRVSVVRLRPCSSGAQKTWSVEAASPARRKVAVEPSVPRSRSERPSNQSSASTHQGPSATTTASHGTTSPSTTTPRTCRCPRSPTERTPSARPTRNSAPRSSAARASLPTSSRQSTWATSSGTLSAEATRPLSHRGKPSGGGSARSPATPSQVGSGE